MISTTGAKAIGILTLATALLAVGGVVFNDPTLHLPHPYAYVLRIIVMTQAGIFIGLLGASLLYMVQLKIDPSDELLRPIGMATACSALLALYAVMNLSTMLSNVFVTWRTPVLFTAFVIGDWGLALLIKRLHKIAALAKNRSATIKLTFIDTGRPGPDIDLSSGTNVIKP